MIPVGLKSQPNPSSFTLDCTTCHSAPLLTYTQQDLVSTSVAVLSFSLTFSLGEGFRIGGWNLSYLRNDLRLDLSADVGIGCNPYNRLV